jgi:hypothetical protein
VIGASAGYFLGANDAKARAAGNTTPTTGDNGNGNTGDGNGNGNGDPTTPAGKPTTPAASPTTPAAPATEPCLDHTEQLARSNGSPGGLTVLLYIKTTGSEVWICKDTDGKRWYQGHVRSSAEKNGGGRGPLIEGDNALFLSTVQSEGEGYVVTNAGGGSTTKYHVSIKELVIEHGDGRIETQPVLEARPGR